MPTAVRGALLEEQTISLNVTGVLQLTAFTLPMCGASAHPTAQCVCVLSQAGWLSFKTPNFRELVWYGLTLVL